MGEARRKRGTICFFSPFIEFETEKGLFLVSNEAHCDWSVVDRSVGRLVVCWLIS